MSLMPVCSERVKAALVAFAVVLISGCGRNGLKGFEGEGSDGGGIDIHTDAPPSEGKIPARLVVSPDSQTLATGDSATLTARLYYSDNSSTDVTNSALWTSSDAGIVAVAGGTIKALRAGKAVVSAIVGALVGPCNVTVNDKAVLKSITISPPAANLVVGSTVAFTATGQYSDGSTANVTAAATWSAVPASVLAMNGSQGIGRMPGAATVTAVVQGISAQAMVRVSAAQVVQITVLPPTAMVGVGTVARFTADARLSDGTHQDVTGPATWTSNNLAVAVITGNGTAQGSAPGRALITATFNGFSGTATLTVTGAPLIGIQVDPINPTVGVGVSLTFTATGIFADGTRTDITSSVMWTSNSPAVVSVDPTGRALTRTVGTAVITAIGPGMVTGSSTVTVTSVTLRSLAVVPPQVTLTVGGTAVLRAIGTYSDGSTVDLTASAFWTVAPDNVVSTTEGNGFVQAFGVGSAAVTATFAGVSGTAKIVVSAATLLAIVVQPAVVSLPAGATVGLSATGFFSDGSALDITADVAWSSSSDAIATVSNQPGLNGLVTAVKPGDVNIVATLMGVQGTAKVSVVAATLQSIDVTPSDARLTVGNSLNYRAVGTFSDGSMVDLSSQVAWSTSDQNIATISNAPGTQGQLLGRAPGIAGVAATLGAVSGSTTVTVVGRVLTGLTINPPGASTPLGVAVQFTAIASFSDGTQSDVTAQSRWASQNPGVATVDGSGRVTPVGVGGAAIQATFMNLTAVVMFAVTPPVARSVVVTPLALTLPVGFSSQLTATASFSDGTSRDVTTQVVWSTSNPMVANVNGRGLVNTVAGGTAVIRADFMGQSGSSTVTVQ